MSFVIALSSEKIYGMLGAIESMLAKTITLKWVCASHLLTLDEENEDEEEKVYWNKIIK